MLLFGIAFGIDKEAKTKYIGGILNG